MEVRDNAETVRSPVFAPERRPSRRELWLTVGAIAVLQTFTVLTEIGAARNDGSVLSPLMGFAATAVLLWHRTSLTAVGWAVGLLSVGALALYPQTVPGVIAAGLIIVNLVSARSTRQVSWATTAIFALLVAMMAYRSVQEQGRDSVQGLILAALAASLVFGSWVVGQLRRARAQEVDAIRERMRQFEVGQAQAEQIAVLTERTRIAREMHDIIAHSISGIVVLADGGPYWKAIAPFHGLVFGGMQRNIAHAAEELGFSRP
jgi:signal transduction histidine kinase